MTPDRCSTIQARCRRASRRQPQRDRRCRRPGARRAEPACPPDQSECGVTRDGAPIDRPGGDAVAMVHLLERYPRLSERPFDRLCMRHCRVRVGIERCTDCAPACTAASASAPICAGVCGAAGRMRSSFRAVCRNGLDDRGCVIRFALVQMSSPGGVADAVVAVPRRSRKTSGNFGRLLRQAVHALISGGVVARRTS